MNSSISSRIDAIAIKNNELAGYLRTAKKTLSSDPHTTLTKCRIILEKVLFQVFIRELGRTPTQSMVGNLLNDKEFSTKIPHRIRARMNLVRELGNLGPHGGETTKEDATLILAETIYLTEWFISTYEILILQKSEIGISLEMLPQLLAKYKDRIRPEITSVRFSQTKNRCYLQITTVTESAGYLRDEVITRTDLGFIVDDDFETPYFNPKKSVNENAERFVNEFNEVSIVHCTDLFT